MVANHSTQEAPMPSKYSRDYRPGRPPRVLVPPKGLAVPRYTPQRQVTQ